MKLNIFIDILLVIATLMTLWKLKAIESLGKIVSSEMLATHSEPQKLIGFLLGFLVARINRLYFSLGNSRVLYPVFLLLAIVLIWKLFIVDNRRKLFWVGRYSSIILFVGLILEIVFMAGISMVYDKLPISFGLSWYVPIIILVIILSYKESRYYNNKSKILKEFLNNHEKGDEIIKIINKSLQKKE